MSYPYQIYLKAGKEKPILQKHHWIFSGAIEKTSTKDIPAGQIVAVYSAKEILLGYAYYHRGLSLTARMLSFGEADPLETIREAIRTAWKVRQSLFPDATVDSGYRLINAEGDGIPGLIVDRYGDYLVLQSGTAGIDQLLPLILEEFSALYPWKGIYERSSSSSRKQEEKLPPRLHWHKGEENGKVSFLEGGIKLIAPIVEGQKTGYFLDQRGMRDWVYRYAKGKSVLNCFSYTGGFSLRALQGGATFVKSIDISADAIALLLENIGNNSSDWLEKHEAIVGNVFDYLHSAPQLLEDIVILDPPAFAKQKKDLDAACRGYKEINRTAIKKMQPGSILITCSCSYHISPELFNNLIFQSCLEAGKGARIIGHLVSAVDHPANPFHPHGNYLKALILMIE